MESLTIDPSLPFETTEEFAVRQSEGLAIRQREVRFPGVRRSFRIAYDLLCPADKNTVMNLFRTMKGKAGRFLFTPPDESTPLECKFDADEQGWTEETASRRSMAVNFHEAP
jgi:hypothetical protein